MDRRLRALGCRSRVDRKSSTGASFRRWERDSVSPRRAAPCAAGRRCTDADRPSTILIVGDRRKLSTVDQRRHTELPAQDGKGRFRAANVVVCRRSSISNGCCCCCCTNSTHCHRHRHNGRRAAMTRSYSTAKRNPTETGFWFSPVV